MTGSLYRRPLDLGTMSPGLLVQKVFRPRNNEPWVACTGLQWIFGKSEDLIPLIVRQVKFSDCLSSVMTHAHDRSIITAI